jgi:hypothetical protein
VAENIGMKEREEVKNKKLNVGKNMEGIKNSHKF